MTCQYEALSVCPCGGEGVTIIIAINCNRKTSITGVSNNSEPFPISIDCNDNFKLGPPEVVHVDRSLRCACRLLCILA